LICSQATVIEVLDSAAEQLLCAPLAAAKCERCWHVRDDVGSHADSARPLRPLRQQSRR
jgi:isoleucyl-tRNA synthetase